MFEFENVNPQFNNNPLASRSSKSMSNKEGSITSESSSTKTREQERNGLTQLYYYNNYGGTVRNVSLDELRSHTKEFLQEYKEFRMPSDNDKILLCFKRHDTSHSRFPQSSVYIFFESKDKLRQFCIENDLQYVSMSSSIVWLSFHDVVEEGDGHSVGFASKEKIVLEAGRGRLYHVPSKKVAKQLQNRLSEKHGVRLQL